MKKLVCVITMCAVFMSTSLAYAASEKDDLDNKLKNNRSEQVTLDKQIIDLNEKVAEIEKNINDTNTKIEKLNAEAESTELEIANLEGKIKENEEYLGKRLKVINTNYSIGYLKVILSSDSLSDFFNNIYIIKQVVDQDKVVLKDLDESKSGIEQKQQSLQSKKSEQEELKIALEKDSKMVSEDKEELDKLKQELLKQESDLQSEIEAIIAKQEAEQNKNSSTGEVGGVISNGSWPVPGHTRISSGYGYRQHPILNTREFHTGIDIPAPTGTPAVAIDNGTIIYSGVKGGYGNTIMIQHDDGKVSLYAHNSQLLGSVGQRVQKGQAVSKIGSTGMSTGPHLHFEIRINGKHVNPLDYL